MLGLVLKIEETPCFDIRNRSCLIKRIRFNVFNIEVSLCVRELFSGADCFGGSAV